MKIKQLAHIFKLCSESFLLSISSFFIHRDEKCVAIGSWCGNRYADNSRYLAEYISNTYKDIVIYWVGNESIKNEVESNLPGVHFLPINTFSTNLKLLKCKYMFFSQMHNADISSYNVFRGAKLCYLHHGMPIKRWGQDGLSQSVEPTKLASKVIRHITAGDIKYDYFVTSSPLHDKTNCTALAFKGCTPEKNIHSGTPRNDIYFNVSAEMIYNMKKRYSQLLHFDASKKIIMYLPTFRRTQTDVFSFSMLSEEQKREICRLLEKHDCVIIEKSHVAENNQFQGDSDDYIICAPSYMNVQEMMLFAEILISDYSGAFLDYLLLDRPIIHFAYDYEYYKNVDSGLYYDIEDFSAGSVAYDFNNLFLETERLLSGKDEYKSKRKNVREKYMSYENGHASAFIVSTVLGKETVVDEK